MQPKSERVVRPFFYYFFITTALSLVLAGCLFYSSETKPSVSIATISPGAMDGQQVKIDVIINDGENKHSQVIEARKGVSALEAFEMVADLSVKKYPFGSYVYAIDGLRENKDGNGKYWQYYVNDKIVMVAVDNFKINSDAKLEFKYEAQNPEIK